MLLISHVCPIDGVTGGDPGRWPHRERRANRGVAPRFRAFPRGYHCA